MAPPVYVDDDNDYPASKVRSSTANSNPNANANNLSRNLAASSFRSQVAMLYKFVILFYGNFILSFLRNFYSFS